MHGVGSNITSSSSSKGISAASRWLRRRTKIEEGAIFDPSSKDVVSVFEKASTITSTADRQAPTSISKRIPSAILNFQSQHHQKNESSLLIRTGISFSQQLEKIQKQEEDEEDFSDNNNNVSAAISSSLSLLVQLLPTKYWKEAVSCLREETLALSISNSNNNSCQQNKVSLILQRNAQTSSSVWSKNWIRMCNEAIREAEQDRARRKMTMLEEQDKRRMRASASLVFQSSSSSSPRNSSQNSSASSVSSPPLSLVSAFASVSSSLLPLCDSQARNEIERSCVIPLEKKKQIIFAEARSVAKLVQDEIELRNNWSEALRIFVLKRKGDGQQETQLSSIESAAVYCLRQVGGFSMNEKSDNVNVEISTVFSRQLSRIQTQQKQQNKKKSELEIEFLNWCSESASVKLMLAVEYCKQSLSSSSSSSPTNSMSPELLKLLLQNPNSSSSSSSSSSCSTEDFSTVVHFVSQILSPFGSAAFPQNKNNANSNSTRSSNYYSPLSSNGNQQKQTQANNKTTTTTLTTTKSVISSISTLRALTFVLSIQNHQDESSSSSSQMFLWKTVSLLLAGKWSQLPKLSQVVDHVHKSLLLHQTSSSSSSSSNSSSLILRDARRVAEVVQVCFVSMALLTGMSRQEIEHSSSSLLIDLDPSYHQQNRDRQEEQQQHRVLLLFSRATHLAESLKTAFFPKRKDLEGKSSSSTLTQTILRRMLQLNDVTVLGEATHMINFCRDVLGQTTFASRLLLQFIVPSTSSSQQKIEETTNENKVQFLSQHLPWLLASSRAHSFLSQLIKSQQEQKEQNQSLWILAAKAFQNSLEVKYNSKKNQRQHQVLSEALVSCGMWRAALAVSDPSSAQALCERLLESNNHQNSRWALAVSLLTEVAAASFSSSSSCSSSSPCPSILRPRLLMSILKALDTPSAPQDVSVDITIQMSGFSPSASSSSASSSSLRQEQKQKNEVVSLLVSVTRAVLQSRRTRNNSSYVLDQTGNNKHDATEEGESNLVRARVFALSNLLQSTTSSAGGNNNNRGRRQYSGALRSAMLLCADANDWQSALFLISTAALQVPEFSLSPDVVWKVAAVLERAGQNKRVDQLKEYVASRHVENWLISSSSSSADENYSEGFSIPRYHHLPSTSSSSSSSQQTTQNSTASQQQEQHEQEKEDEKNDLLVSNNKTEFYGGLQFEEFVRLRCSAIQRDAAVGRWKAAVTLLSDLLGNVKRKVRRERNLKQEQNEREVEEDKNKNNERALLLPSWTPLLVSKAFASAIKVCALRKHWQEALFALSSLSQNQFLIPSYSSSSPFLLTNSSSSFSTAIPAPPLSSLFIRLLAQFGRWKEATMIFSETENYHFRNNRSQQQQHNTTQQHSPGSLFVALTRACRLSRTWLAALHLHNSRPDLVSFSSVGEVVGACSACGFPLTKIQLWLNVAKSSLFLISSSSENSKVENSEASTSSSSSSSSSVPNSPLSSVDVAVFFALLNAQSHHHRHNNNNQSQNSSSSSSDDKIISSDAWARSLTLLQRCWSSSSSSSSSSIDNKKKQQKQEEDNFPVSVYSAARSPDCVTSVIDTCLKHGKWQEAFNVYKMQRILLIPATEHSVFVLLAALLDRSSSSSSSPSSSSHSPSSASTMTSSATTTTTTTAATWLSACQLVSDAVHRDSIKLRPVMCERFIHVLCRGGKWEAALGFAHTAGPSMNHLMTNDRVLDTFVRCIDADSNPVAICKLACESGTFPVSAHHALGTKVLKAVRNLILLNNNKDNSSSVSEGENENEKEEERLLKIALKALYRCIRLATDGGDVADRIQDSSSSDFVSLNQVSALSNLALLRRSSEISTLVSSALNNNSNVNQLQNEDNKKNRIKTVREAVFLIERWISNSTSTYSSNNNDHDDDTSTSSSHTSDLAFAHLLCFAFVNIFHPRAMENKKKGKVIAKEHREKAETYLRLVFLMQLSHDNNNENKVDIKKTWPRRIQEIATSLNDELVLADYLVELSENVMVKMSEEMLM